MNFSDVYNQLVEELMRQRDPATGVWTGRLSSSALATALAVTALEDGDAGDRERTGAGVQWLVATINSDGGWGDTPQSPSNISTSLIVRAALSRHSQSPGVARALAASEQWMMARTGDLSLASVAETLHSVYGSDKTFAVPILMYLALCSGAQADWRQVPALPFMLALLPGWCYRFFKLEVVSYALPALIAVGLCRHVRAAAACGRKPWAKLFAARLLRKLEGLQPEHGGFLDAAPLTAFVVLALKNCGYAGHPVVERGAAFLRSSARQGGSWPIDSNLRIWLSSLSARALAEQLAAEPDQAGQVAEWLIRQQQLNVHPYTGARPGGWAWTDLPGGVPDADDTAAALIALFYLKDFTKIAPLTKTVRLGVSWLMDLQNRDGGMPTFCRGWGQLPFDKSCCDITAHALEALTLWAGYIPKCDYLVFDDGFMARLHRSALKMLAFLERSQQSDGAWLPLWFGHQQSPGKFNSVIGTARVVSGLRPLLDPAAAGDESLRSRVAALIDRAENLLVHAQKAEGGWSAGCDATVEESALVITALSRGSDASRAAACKGAAWLADTIAGHEIKAVPVGLYFSVLWYDEELYPLIWSIAALRPFMGGPDSLAKLS